MADEMWLVRHAETEWSASGRHTSRTDVALTDEGRMAATSLAARLGTHSFAAVFTSPKTRARETAMLAGFPDAHVLDDLREWDYGANECLTTPEIREHTPGWTIWTGPTPHGETAEQIEARARRVLQRCDGVTGDVLLFGHGHLLRAFTAVALGFRAVDGAHFALDPGRMGVVGWEHEYRALRRWNLT